MRDNINIKNKQANLEFAGNLIQKELQNESQRYYDNKLKPKSKKKYLYYKFRNLIQNLIEYLGILNSMSFAILIDDFINDIFKNIDFVTKLLTLIFKKGEAHRSPSSDKILVPNSAMQEIVQNSLCNLLISYILHYKIGKDVNFTETSPFYIKILLNSNIFSQLAKVALGLIFILKKIGVIHRDTTKLLGYINLKSKHKSFFWELDSDLSYFILQNSIVKNVPIITQLSTDDLTASNFFLEPVHGFSTVDQPEKVLTSLNISQQTTSSINKIYLKLLLDINDSTNPKILSPFPTELQMSNQNELVSFLKNKIDHFYKFEILHKLFLRMGHESKSNKKIIITKIYNLLNISLIELRQYNFYLKENNKFKTMCNDKNKFWKCITLAKHLNNYQFCIPKFCDYRLRIYEKGCLAFSAGYLKHLLTDTAYLKQNFVSFQYILISYYRHNSYKLKKFKNFLGSLNLLDSDKTNITKLIDYFRSNQIKILDDLNKDFFYLKLLKLEIDKLINCPNFSTNFRISIDQKTSGVCLLSLLFSDREAAIHSNLVSKNQKDIYVVLLKKLLPWLKNNCPGFNRYTKKMSHLFKNRNFFKSGVMKFFYSQTWTGRLNDWKKIIVNSVGTINEKIYSQLKWFSLNFEKFLSNFFPDLLFNIRCLKKLCVSTFKLINKISIKTLDGSLISWGFFSKVPYKFKLFNSYLDKYISSSAQHLELSENDQKVISRFSRSILPNVIHSIDGGILRIIVSQMFTVTGYRLVHLHDSFMCNPVLLDTLYTLLSNFYKSSSTHDWLNTLIFDPILFSIKDQDPQSILKIKRLINKFKRNNPITSRRYFNIKNLYPIQ